MKDQIVFFNGSFIPIQKANISIYDRGLLYGDGLFETMRTYHGKVFALERHLKRMVNSAKILNIPFTDNITYWQRIIKKLIRLNNLINKDSYIRITLTRGVDPGVLLPLDKIKPTIIVIAKPVASNIKKRQKTGIKAITLNFSKVSSPLSSIKSLNFLDNVIGSMMARESGADEAIFTSPSGEILEGTVSNIFIVKNGFIKTPPLMHGILTGITRQFVIDIAKNMGLRVKEIPTKKRDVLNSDEAFITNSIIEIAPLIMIDKKIIGTGKARKVTLDIQRAYKNLVKTSITS